MAITKRADINGDWKVSGDIEAENLIDSGVTISSITDAIDANATNIADNTANLDVAMDYILQNNSGCILDEHYITFVEDGGLWYAEMRGTAKSFNARTTYNLRVDLGGTVYTIDCTTGPGTGGRARSTPITMGTAGAERVNFFQIVEDGSGGVEFTCSLFPPSDEPFAWAGQGTWFDDTYTTANGPYNFFIDITALLRNGEDKGAIAILTERVNALGTEIATGLEGSIDIDNGTGKVALSIGAGVVYQTIGVDIAEMIDVNEYYVLNNQSGQITIVTDLTDITLDAVGDDLKVNNRHFALEFGLIVNSCDVPDRVVVWLPYGIYSQQEDEQAIADTFRFSQVPSPSLAFRRLAVRICRAVFEWNSGDTYTNLLGGNAVQDRRTDVLGGVSGSGSLSGTGVLDNYTLTGAGTTTNPEKVTGLGLVVADAAMIGSNPDTSLFDNSAAFNAKLDDAASDGKTYGRKDGAWAEVVAGGGDVEEAPEDGKAYARKDADWVEATGLDAGPFEGIKVKVTSDITIGALSTATSIAYDEETFNTNTSNYSYSTSTDLVTITDAGYYQITIGGDYNGDPSAAVTFFYTTVTVDGGEGFQATSNGVGTSSGTRYAADKTSVLYLDAGTEIGTTVQGADGTFANAKLRGSATSDRTYLVISKADGVKGDKGDSGVIPSTAETITATNIDWSVDATYFKSVTADESYSFSNVTDGMVLSVVIEADATERTISFPIVVKWPDNTEIDKVAANTTRIFTFIAANSEVFATSAGGYV